MRILRFNDRGDSVGGALLWKLLERFGVQGIQFVLQIVLARLLEPEHYGTLSIMVVFTNLANMFIQTGLNTALIQRKDIEEEDYSSVLCVTLGMATVLYGAIFFGAPYIAKAYEMPDLIVPLRVLALMLFPGAVNSVQLAKLSREMQFRKMFINSIISIVVSGVISIIIALLGGGLWALVFQSVLQGLVNTIVMRITVRWKPRLRCNFKRVRGLISFGWKLLASSLLDTLYQDLSNLVVGLKYSSDTLGFYNRGKQFPQFLITAINGTVQSVMLPVMSAKQDEKSEVKKITRNSIMISAYIIFPMMAGLAAVAEPLVELLLTEKWLPAVPYMQIYCFALAFYPVHSCNLQAINAMGRSDIYLKLEFIKKGLGTVLLFGAVFLFDTPIAIAMTGVFSTLINCFTNSYPNKKLIGYSYFEQMKDILPSAFAALIMLVGVLFVGRLELPNIVLLVVQVITGVLLYAALSVVLRLEPFKMLMQMLKDRKK